MSYRLPVILIVISSVLSACALTPNKSVKTQPVIPLNIFIIPKDFKVETDQEIFYLGKDALHFVHQLSVNHPKQKDKLNALVYAIFDRAELGLAYRSNANTVAQQTFVNRRANCLSLTIMAYAMLQELDIDADFQEVDIPEFWSTRNGNTIINQHVNLATSISSNGYLPIKTDITIDFNPQEISSHLRTTTLSKKQLISYFYTNKGAEYLIQSNGNENSSAMALAYFLKAIAMDEHNEGAWLNLGVLFAREGYLNHAQEYYEHAIALDPSFTSGYENLALLLKKQGKPELAASQLAKLHKQRQSNPYYHLMLGEKASAKNDYAQAIRHYKKAMAINKRLHRIHFNLAKAYFALNDIQKAEKALFRARSLTKDNDLKNLYSSKINSLY